jgi:hypothetical protein
MGNLPLLKIVLAKDVVDIDGNGVAWPILHVATMNECLPVVHHLLGIGANMWRRETSRPQDGTIFEKAILSGRVDLVLLFVEALKVAGGDTIWPVRSSTTVGLLFLPMLDGLNNYRASNWL